jgi:hypothetical protein
MISTILEIQEFQDYLSKNFLKRISKILTIVYARQYVIIHISAETKLDLNGLIINIQDKSIIHFPLGIMGVTQISVSPKPLSVEYRFADDLAIEVDKYRNESMKIKLPDGSMGIITDRLLRKME